MSGIMTSGMTTSGMKISSLWGLEKWLQIHCDKQMDRHWCLLGSCQKQKCLFVSWKWSVSDLGPCCLGPRLAGSQVRVIENVTVLHDRRFSPFLPSINFLKEIEIEYRHVHDLDFSQLFYECSWPNVGESDSSCWSWPIRGQYPGPVIALDQSEARIWHLSLKLQQRPSEHHMWLLKMCQRSSHYSVTTPWLLLKLTNQRPGHVIALDQSEAAVTTPGYLRTRRNNEDVVVKGIWFETFF